MDEQRTFEVTLSGCCVSSFMVTVDRGFIVECDFIGGCRSNLRILRNNLIGEPIDQAHNVILANCCSDVRDRCVRKLETELLRQFEMICREVGYGK